MQSSEITKRKAFAMGWNNVYCKDEYAFPPLDGELLAALEEGIKQGELDKAYDLSTGTYPLKIDLTRKEAEK